MIDPGSDDPAASAPEPQRTAPLSLVIGALSGLSNAIVPAILAGVSLRNSASFALVALAVAVVGALVVGITGLVVYLSWRRLTYTVGAQDIRVESGVISRSARSVPYERIQDVSLEQKLLARLFGLVAVRFETGAGGGDDLTLAFLTEAEGERLRQLVRARRDAEPLAAAGPQGATGSIEPGARADPADQTLFAMGPRRLLIFGTFEFSLAVFAVLAGLLQYADNLAGVSLWDPDLWAEWLEGGSKEIASLGLYAQVLSAIAGLIAVFVIGSVTGLVRTFVREWGFLLERTARGFRRRRGLLTRTDVVMPVHRVQAIEIGTRLLRYRFGWHALSFVSLAQDAGQSSHVVAPFAKMSELAPIVASAGFELPDERADWHKASEDYRNASAFFGAVWFLLAAIPVGIFAPPGVVLIPLGLALVVAGASVYAWEFHRHAFDAEQIMATRGLVSPQSRIANRVKLHSVEIAQGPIGRWRGYATLHFGLAGGEFSIPGVPLERARAVRREVLDTIAATDFSQLENG